VVQKTGHTTEAVNKAVWLPVMMYWNAYAIVLGALLLWKRQKGPKNNLLFLSAVAIAFLFMPIVGFLPLAVLTTRPSTESQRID